MKTIFRALLLMILIVSCKNESKPVEEVAEPSEEMAYVSFGEKIDDKEALESAEMKAQYNGLAAGDSLEVKMRGKVNSVCQAKGCWMRLDLGDNEEVMVKFKDYGFFMPKNIAGEEVVIDGMAYVDEMSVEEQQHYAQDAGKSEEEIAAITEPKRTYTFVADGVLLKE